MTQNGGGALPAWRVWGSTALWLAVSALMLWAQYLSLREAAMGSSSSAGVVLATAKKPTDTPVFSRCQMVGIIINRMAFQRDNGYPRENMLSNFEKNEILDRNLYNLMVNMVYDHPDKSPDSIEKSIVSGC